MKKLSLIVMLGTILSLVACGNEIDTTYENAPTQDEFDQLQLAYINLEEGSLSNGGVSCEHKPVGKYVFAACRFASPQGSSASQIWFYDNKKDPIKRFYAFTGNARTTYGRLTSNPYLGDYQETFGLPVPNDMNIGQVVQAFKK